MKKLVQLVTLALLLVSQARATYTKNTAAGYACAYASATYNPTTGVLSWSYNIPGQSGGNSYGAWLATCSGGYGSSYVAAVFDYSPVGPISDSGSFVPVRGIWYQIAARISESNGNVTDQVFYFNIPELPHQKTPITFHNDKTYPIEVYARDQSGSVIEHWTVMPGQSPTKILDTAGSVTNISLTAQAYTVQTGSEGIPFYATIGGEMIIGATATGANYDANPPLFPVASGTTVTQNSTDNSSISSPTYNTNITSSTALSASVYAQGVKAITDALASIWTRLGSIGGGGGGGGGNVTVTGGNVGISGGNVAVPGVVSALTFNGTVDPNPANGTIGDSTIAEADKIKRVNGSTMLGNVVPTFFSSTAMNDVHTLGVAFPPISIASKTLAMGNLTIDFSPHYNAISLFRACCSVCLYLGFYVACVQTIKGAGAGK